jgi:serine/threonine protein kinase
VVVVRILSYRPGLVRFCTQCGSGYQAHVDYCAIDGARLAELADDPLIGRTIDRYRVIEPLGRGGMGCVYRVGHLVLEHEYAMKVLSGDLAADHRIVERFRLEAKSVSRMRHPNVVAVTDFGVSPEGLTFLVMELIQGKTLASIIAEDAPLKPQRAAEITRQIAAGLAEAHRLGLVHRDIKPSNIMVTREGELEFVKILDFGIVGVAQGFGVERITTTEQFIGTPQYMAPEQALGPALLGPPADLYSLGIILFEMLTRRLPFDGHSAMEILVKHITEPAPEIPPAQGLELLVRWLLEKSSNKRPQSGAEVIAEIDRLVRDVDDRPEPPRAGPLTDTLEMYVEDVNLGDAQEKLREAVAAQDAEAAPKTIVNAPASDLAINFESPVTYPGAVNPFAGMEKERSGEVALAGYEVLREKLDRVHGVLTFAKQNGTHSRLSELLHRYEEMCAAVRPGLRPYRYNDLASKIAKLEDDVRELRSG